jgi:hypothetical protein
VTADVTKCFLCSRSFSAGKGRGLNKRFCGPLYEAAFDAGYLHRENDTRYQFPVRGEGFFVNCASCNRPFVSKGSKFCGDTCNRQAREQADIAKVMAEVGATGTGYVYRQCQHCGGNIPRYVGVGQSRKATRADARFSARNLNWGGFFNYPALASGSQSGPGNEHARLLPQRQPPKPWSNSSDRHRRQLN